MCTMDVSFHYIVYVVNHQESWDVTENKSNQSINQSVSQSVSHYTHPKKRQQIVTIIIVVIFLIISTSTIFKKYTCLFHLHLIFLSSKKDLDIAIYMFIYRIQWKILKSAVENESASTRQNRKNIEAITQSAVRSVARCEVPHFYYARLT